MGVILTSAGEGLIARLQAEGKPLIIDKFVFAHFEGIDPTAQTAPSQGLPDAEKQVHETLIPPEYRAFVNPNQVVYSALLGSDVGDFRFNWQGLYCSEHATLIAVATFPALEKRAYNAQTNTAGNNLTRNFILEFSGAQSVTGITVQAAVWQLDFTVRHRGIDERERLSNRDYYGRAAFLDNAWKLEKEGGSYFFRTGVGYVEGIRVTLDANLLAMPEPLPCDVYLDVCQEMSGSDLVTVATPVFYAVGVMPGDYTTPAPFRTRHYLEKVAHIAANNTVTEARAGSPTDWLVPKVRKLTTTAPLTGGGDLTGDLTLGFDAKYKPCTALEVVTTTKTYTVTCTGYHHVTCIGGGGGGGGGAANASFGGGGGGGGAGYIIEAYVLLTEGQIIPCTIGAGGAQGYGSYGGSGSNGGGGGTTSFGGLAANGGGGGFATSVANGLQIGYGGGGSDSGSNPACGFVYSLMCTGAAQGCGLPFNNALYGSGGTGGYGQVGVTATNGTPGQPGAIIITAPQK